MAAAAAAAAAAVRRGVPAAGGRGAAAAGGERAGVREPDVPEADGGGGGAGARTRLHVRVVPPAAGVRAGGGGGERAYGPLRLDLKYRDDNCSEYLAPNVAMELYMEHKTVAFFGPVCNYAFAPVARFASYRQLPLFTAGALVDAFDDSASRATCTRRSPGCSARTRTSRASSCSCSARSAGAEAQRPQPRVLRAGEQRPPKGRRGDFMCPASTTCYVRNVGYSRNVPRHQFSVSDGWIERIAALLRSSKTRREVPIQYIAATATAQFGARPPARPTPGPSPPLPSDTITSPAHSHVQSLDSWTPTL